MKIMKNTHGIYFLEIDDKDSMSIYRDWKEKFKSATVIVEDLHGFVKNTDSAVLEDLFHTVNAELLMRDKMWIAKNL